MRRLNITIIAGLLAALIGGLLVFSYGKKVDEKIAEGKETVGVLVAASELAAGTVAEALEGKVEVQQIPREYVSSGAISDLADVAGLALVAPVPEGAQLSEGLFSSAGQLAALKPDEGSVALAVQVDLPAGVARYITTGSFVDVFATYQQLEGQTDSVNRTKLILSGAKVLSVSIAAPTTEEDASGSAVPIDQVLAVLQLRPQEAERVVNATELGQIYLALTNEGEFHETPDGAVPDDVVDANGGGR